MDTTADGKRNKVAGLDEIFIEHNENLTTFNIEGTSYSIQ
jgi:hypothetical protein